MMATKTCPICHITNLVQVPDDVAQALGSPGTDIATVWPGATAGQLEAATSGAHMECWDDLCDEETC